MQLKKGSIKSLEKYCAFKIKERGFEDESLHERLLLLVEEVGELVKACRKISGMNVDKNREIMTKTGEEIADVINLTFAVAIKLGLNTEREFVEKENIINKRVYSRSKHTVEAKKK